MRSLKQVWGLGRLSLGWKWEKTTELGECSGILRENEDMCLSGLIKGVMQEGAGEKTSLS